MKTLLRILCLFFLFVFPWDAVGQEGVAIGDQTATVKAETSSAVSSLHSGKIMPISAHQKSEKDVNRSNSSSFLDTLIDSRDDLSESIFVESFVQRHASIFIHDLSTIEHGIPTDKLIFPFHFFL